MANEFIARRGFISLEGAQITGSLSATGNISSNTLTVTNGITGTATSASYVEYSNVAGKPALVSGSSQISFNGITDKPTLVSGSSQITYSEISSIPSGIVSSSAQVGGYNIFATTGSNTFQANQIVTGSLFITQNLVVAGSSSIQYISSSVVDIADNIITVNAFNPGVRFGGLAVADSGSSPRVSGSILFDSIKDQWIFVHESSATTSSVLLMGPETYNDLGNEAYISSNRLPKGSGIEHLRDSNITDTGTVVSVNSNTAVTGSFTVITGSAVELQVTNTGVNIGSTTVDNHNVTGSLRVTGSMSVAPSITITGDGSNDIFKAVRSGVTRVVIKNGVNTLGINTDTINNPLTVNGGADFSGSVGIGVTSPSVLLQVNPTNTANLVTSLFTTGGSDNNFKAGFANGSGTEVASEHAKVGMWYGTSGNPVTHIGFLRGNSADSLGMTFSVNNTERMRITSGGNVGIGVTDLGPDGLSLASGLNYSWSEGSGNAYAVLFRQRNSAATVVASGYKRSSTAGFASSFGTSMARAAIAVGYNNGSIAFFSDSATNVANGTDIAPTERMTILNNGNVGIGTSGPVQKLHVEGSTAIGTTGTEDILILGRALGGGVSFQQAASLKLGRYQNAGGSFESYTRLDIALRDNSAANNYNTNTTVMTLTNAGNVGIGTTSPGTNLHVEGPTISYGQVRILSTSTSTGEASIHFGRTNQTLEQRWTVGQGVASIGDSFGFYTGGSPRVVLTTGGNVLIGTTTNLGSELNVNSTIRVGVAFGSAAAIAFGDSGTPYWNVGRPAGSGNFAISSYALTALTIAPTTGNVGIGTSSTDEKLTIQSGNIKLYSVQNAANDYRYIGTEYSSGNGNNKAEIRFAIDGSDTNTRLTFHTANGGGTINERMRITSGGNVGIGTVSPDAGLTVETNFTSFNALAVRSSNAFSTTPETAIAFRTKFNTAGAYSTNGLIIGYKDNATDGNQQGGLQFWTNAGSGVAEKMRITSGGDVLLGATSFPAGERMMIQKAEAAPLGLDRRGSDGGILRFYQDGAEEGNVTVSGNTVSYNSFLGSHWSQLQDGSKPTILKGTILEAIDELCVWENETNDRLPKSKISDTVESKNVYGAFLVWDEEWESTNDFFVAAVGLGYIRVHSSQNVTIGDLLQSNGDGTAKIQSDDIMRSSTIAKVVSTQKIETYEDGSYLIAATLHCG